MDEMNMNEMANEVAEVTDISDIQNNNGGILGKLVAGIAVAGIAGVGAFIYKKTGKKRREKQIEKLKKEGYTVIEPEAPIEAEFVEESGNSKKK